MFCPEMMILRGIGHRISYIGVPGKNDPQTKRWGGVLARSHGLVFSSAAGGAHWQIAIRCPSLPFPSVKVHQAAVLVRRFCFSMEVGGGGWHKALVVGSVSLWRRLLAPRL